MTPRQLAAREDWPEVPPSFGQRVRRFLGACVAAALLALLTAAFTGAGVQFIETRREAKQYPPPGKVYTIHRANSYKANLHAFIRGEGSPTIVFESGLGETSLSWAKVAPEIAKDYRTVVYDRAGMGWSGRSPQVRTAEEIARELRELLGEAGVSGPYVLVGHSLGGFYIRAFQTMYPDQVGGMVFVDCSHEDQFDRFPKDPLWVNVLNRILPHVFRWTAYAGSTRPIVYFFGGSLFLLDSRGLNADEAGALRSFYTRPLTFETIARESGGIAAGAEFLRRTRRPAGDLPIEVLTGLKDKEAMGPEFPAIWRELQADLASLSNNSKHYLFEDAGHFIQNDKPEEVIAAIRRVAAQVVVPPPPREPSPAAIQPADTAASAEPLHVATIWGSNAAEPPATTPEPDATGSGPGELRVESIWGTPDEGVASTVIRVKSIWGTP